MNALARIGTDVDPSRLTLWSTQQPCSMCQAAIDFIGISNVRVIATDPSNPADRAAEAVDDECPDEEMPGAILIARSPA